MSLARAFAFTTVPNLLVETGASSKVGDIAKSLGCRSVVLVTDKVLRSLGLTENAEKGCAEAGVRCSVFDAVEEDPPERVINDLVRFCREEEADGVVGLGGGSPMDCAKLAAFLCGDTRQDLADCYGVGFCVGERLPLIQVPTTAGELLLSRRRLYLLSSSLSLRCLLPPSPPPSLHPSYWGQALAARSRPFPLSQPATRRKRVSCRHNSTLIMPSWTAT